MPPQNRKEDLVLAANTLRGLAIDCVEAANSGHPGLPMGMADLSAQLWLEWLRYDVNDPRWHGRDRFILSAGHGSALLYGLLHLAGFGVSTDDLRAFRQIGSKTPGHPEVGETEGVETTTGPLGQGLGNAIGMALGAKLEAERFECPLAATHRVIALVSDGDLMEGVASEAASLAGHLRLENLFVFYDDNRITIDGRTDLAFTEDVGKRFEAYGWRVLRCENANDPEAVATALQQTFGQESNRPTLVVCRSVIGYGAPTKQDTAGSHGAPLGPEEAKAAKTNLGLDPEQSFAVPDEVRALFRIAATKKAEEARRFHEDMESWRAVDEDRAHRLAMFRDGTLPENLFELACEAVAGEDGATRALGGTVLNRLAESVPGLVGGSADLAASCKTTLKNSSDVTGEDFRGRNLHFGIREHGMGAILNGLALHGGHVPFGSTFLVFSDYMRPSMRLAALMGLRTTYVFTHDSLMVGEDGPTHQPIEHAAALRLIPGLHVYRPADGLEVAAAWTHAIERKTGPTAILLTRQGLPVIERPDECSPEAARKGAYLCGSFGDAPTATLIASGSEVSLALEAAALLADRGLSLRVVSAPCLEVFEQQSREWRDQVLPPDLPVVSLELGTPQLWPRFTGNAAHCIGIERFGRSGPANELAAAFGFTPEAVADQISAMLS
ncbi:MAG: transketolase [Planctomycetota bacterium]